MITAAQAHELNMVGLMLMAVCILPPLAMLACAIVQYVRAK